LKRLFLLALPLALAIVAPQALAAFIFRVGDTVYLDVNRYRWNGCRKTPHNPESETQSQPAAAAPAAEPRAAACTTVIYYDEFPSEDERFQCSADLGMLTREQIMERGWRVDFVEKIPPLPSQPAQSPRGLPLYLYKLVISR